MATALPKKVWGKKSEVKGVLIRFDCWQKESNLKQSDKLQTKQFLTVSIMHAFY